MQYRCTCLRIWLLGSKAEVMVMHVLREGKRLSQKQAKQELSVSRHFNGVIIVTEFKVIPSEIEYRYLQ